MLSSEDLAQVGRAAELLELLGIMSRESILEYCEHDRMRKEEIAQRTHEMLILVRAELLNSKKKKKGKKGAKKGKKK